MFVAFVLAISVCFYNNILANNQLIMNIMYKHIRSIMNVILFVATILSKDIV